MMLAWLSIVNIYSGAFICQERCLTWIQDLDWTSLLQHVNIILSSLKLNVDVKKFDKVETFSDLWCLCGDMELLHIHKTNAPPDRTPNRYLLLSPPPPPPLLSLWLQSRRALPPPPMKTTLWLEPTVRIQQANQTNLQHTDGLLSPPAWTRRGEGQEEQVSWRFLGWSHRSLTAEALQEEEKLKWNSDTESLMSRTSCENFVVTENSSWGQRRLLTGVELMITWC